MEETEKTIINKFDEVMQVLMKAFHASDSSSLSGLEVTIQQFIVLHLIDRKECPKMTDLAEELGVTMGNMTAMADRLIKADYIVRKDDPDDRRVVRVCLTQQGRELIKKAVDRKRKGQEMILNKLSATDRDDLFRIINKLIAAIKREEGEKRK